MPQRQIVQIVSHHIHLGMGAVCEHVDAVLWLCFFPGHQPRLSRANGAMEEVVCCTGTDVGLWVGGLPYSGVDRRGVDAARGKRAVSSSSSSPDGLLPVASILL